MGRARRPELGRRHRERPPAGRPQGLDRGGQRVRARADPAEDDRSFAPGLDGYGRNGVGERLPRRFEVLRLRKNRLSELAAHQLCKGLAFSPSHRLFFGPEGTIVFVKASNFNGV